MFLVEVSCPSVHVSPVWPNSYTFYCEGMKKHPGLHHQLCGRTMVRWNEDYTVDRSVGK